MIIELVQAFPLYVDPVQGNYLGANGRADGRKYLLNPPYRSLYSAGYETLVVKVIADGVVGWGEALAPVAPHVAAQVVERLLCPLLIGQNARDVPVLWHRMSESMRERGHLTGHQADAMAAVDIALWDLRGRAEGRPVADLIGGRFRESIPTYLSGLRGDNDAERADTAAEFAERGVRNIKLHLGRGVKSDLATVDAVLGAVPDARIAVDAHWSYSLGEAKALGRGLDERNAWFFEAPLAPEDAEGHRDLAAHIATPVAVGEAMRSRFEFADWLQRRAMQISQPDIARTGITEGMAIAGLTDAFHGRVAPHHSAALGIAMAAGLHVSAATPSLLAFEYQAHTMTVASRILGQPLEAAPDGSYTVTDAPGLGVEVDEDAVRSFIAD
ncbi:mandelate racemase/muconate lactonizing enzyme family protein [Pseudarthrobacter sp. 1C304]|uniref:mandelate racemase/muconate lactonizing enzyme family protein n=1 Tax=Pseudarthrobacter sp. 1C304 TaxID=3457438 RepID=UPI003FD5AA5A